MHDAVEVTCLQDCSEGRAIGEVADHELRARREGLPVALGKVVVCHHAVAGLEQCVGDHAADVACTSGDKDLQRAPSTFICSAPSAGEQTKTSGLRPFSRAYLSATCA